jgi:hypothetical protein
VVQRTCNEGKRLMTESTTPEPTERKVLHRILQVTPSLDGSYCTVWDYGSKDSGRCKQSAVARTSYALWWRTGLTVPKGVPDPSTLFVGVCQDHLDALRTVMKGKGFDLEALERLP